MSEHVVSVEHRPRGGATVVRLWCSCGRWMETGDNYGKVPLSVVENQLRYSLRQEHLAASQDMNTPEPEHEK